MDVACQLPSAGGMTLAQARARWRKKPTDELAAEVETLGRIEAKKLSPSDWDLSKFDQRSLTRVLAWLETAADAFLLPVLRHLRTHLPDPRATRPLLGLLQRQFIRPIDRATVIAGLKQNADPRQPALAESLGVARALLISQAEEAQLLQFADRRAATLEAMFKRPDDLTTRTVTADWLMGFGDPLGELMALQLGRAPRDAPSPRETELLGQHLDAFMHDLFAPAPVRELVFVAVPAHVTIARPITFTPACATLESVSLISGTRTFSSHRPGHGSRVRAPSFKFRRRSCWASGPQC